MLSARTGWSRTLQHEANRLYGDGGTPRDSSTASRRIAAGERDLDAYQTTDAAGTRSLTGIQRTLTNIYTSSSGPTAAADAHFETMNPARMRQLAPEKGDRDEHSVD